jgi:hypothetical protein
MRHRHVSEVVIDITAEQPKPLSATAVERLRPASTDRVATASGRSIRAPAQVARLAV